MTAIAADVVLYRGDTAPVFAMRYLPLGAAADLTGWAFLLTVHSIQNPTSTATQVYQLSGVITDATAGDFEFSVPQDDAEGTAPGTYYYDVQAADADGLVRTIATGTWTIRQDYTKNLGTQAVLPRLVLPPDEIAAAWPLLPNVWETSPGKFILALDPATLKPTTEDVLYVKTAGSDLAAGATPATALASTWKALLLAEASGNPTTIYVESGTYGTTTGILGTSLAVDVVIKATDDLSDPTTPGKVLCTVAPDGLAWALEAGTDAVYKAALAAAPSMVVDRLTYAAHGEGSRLPARASIAACDVAAGGWYWSGGQLYARVPGGRVLDDDVLAMKAAQVNGLCNLGDRKLYVEGVAFLGGTSAWTMSEVERAIFVDCDFDHGALYGMSLSSDVAGADHAVYLIRCRARGNGSDGFQFTALGAGSTMRALLVDCQGSGNGFDGANINNGFTTHRTSGTAVSVAIGGKFDDNEGPNVAHAGAGNLAWCLGVEASGTVASQNQSNFYSDGTMWLQSCRARDNVVDLVAGAGATVYRADMPGVSTGGAGAHAEYDP